MFLQRLFGGALEPFAAWPFSVIASRPALSVSSSLDFGPVDLVRLNVHITPLVGHPGLLVFDQSFSDHLLNREEPLRRLMPRCSDPCPLGEGSACLGPLLSLLGFNSFFVGIGLVFFVADGAGQCDVVISDSSPLLPRIVSLIVCGVLSAATTEIKPWMLWVARVCPLIDLFC